MKFLKRYSVWMPVVLLLLCSCSKAQKSSTTTSKLLADKNVLIVYLSRTSNTKAVAEIIHKNVGGTLVALEVQNPYPENYQQTVDQVRKENETGYLPPIKTKIDSLDKYDIVFVGFPTWGMQLPPPMKSFLSQNNFKGKTIIPFNTNAGYGVGSSFDKVKELSAESTVLDGFFIKGGIERDGILFVMEGEKRVDAEQEIIKWLSKININLLH